MMNKKIFLNMIYLNILLGDCNAKIGKEIY